MYLETTRRHRVDAVRRLIYAADLQRVLVFMNQQQTLQVLICFCECALFLACLKYAADLQQVLVFMNQQQTLTHDDVHP